MRGLSWLAVCGALSVCLVQAAELPEGAGKEVIGRVCVGCHVPDSLSSYKHTPDEWQSIIQRMGQRATAATKEELETVTAYLTKNFPKVVDPTKINVNKAQAKDLETLGLTAKEAEAIVQYRGKNGDFREWGDLLVIYGVDGKKIKAAKDNMSF